MDLHQKLLMELESSYNLDVLDKKILKMTVETYNDSVEDFISHIKDIFYGGCESGVVNGLMLYQDTLAFYEEYKDIINKKLSYDMDCQGIYNLNEFFLKGKWDKDDPLALDSINQNLLAWYGYEEGLRYLVHRIISLNLGWEFKPLEKLL